MTGAQVDFAVFGSSPLAGLVAGLLATRHKRDVIIVGEVEARYRLPRAVDLSVAPITRPETWALLSANVQDVSRLIARIGGRNGLRHIDPIFFADGPVAREALGHFSHMARAHGRVLEAVPPSTLGVDRMALRISDAVTLSRSNFEPALEAWLREAGVRRLAPEAAHMAAGGGAEIAIGAEAVMANHAILVDDDAIFRHLPGWQWPQQLLRRAHASILIASRRHLASPIMVQLDSGTVLVQHEEGGMAALGRGTLSAFSGALGGLLADSGQLQQVGQVGFEALATGDGAPLVGPAGADGASLLTGLGATGVFLAPVLARWFAGEASAEETEWCEARRPDRDDIGNSVAEFTSGIEERAA